VDNSDAENQGRLVRHKALPAEVMLIQGDASEPVGKLSKEEREPIRRCDEEV
jgi:hypothetical protein